MKKWFLNLKESYKMLIYIVLGLILIIIPCTINDNVNFFISLVWITALVFEILFLMWQVKHEKLLNKQKTKNSTQGDNIINNLITNFNSKRKTFEISINTREYTNDRIKSIIQEYINEDFFDEDEIYEGLTNSEIEESGYEIFQLNNPTISANVRDFEDSNTFGVYMRSYNDDEIYIGTIPKDKVDEIRNVLVFGDNIECNISLSGGKYKEYDYDKDKIVTKETEYVPTLNISCILSNEAEEEMKLLIEQENYEKNNNKIYYSKIVGVSFNNEDGSNRKNILNTLNFNEELKLEKYYYNGEKAVKVLTKESLTIGNIPKDLANDIFDLLEKNKIEKVYYFPTIDKEKTCVSRLKYLVTKN